MNAESMVLLMLFDLGFEVTCIPKDSHSRSTAWRYRDILKSGSDCNNEKSRSSENRGRL